MFAAEVLSILVDIFVVLVIFIL